MKPGAGVFLLWPVLNADAGRNGDILRKPRGTPGPLLPVGLTVQEGEVERMRTHLNKEAVNILLHCLYLLCVNLDQKWCLRHTIDLITKAVII